MAGLDLGQALAQRLEIAVRPVRSRTRALLQVAHDPRDLIARLAVGLLEVRFELAEDRVLSPLELAQALLVVRAQAGGLRTRPSSTVR